MRIGGKITTEGKMRTADFLTESCYHVHRWKFNVDLSSFLTNVLNMVLRNILSQFL